MSIKFKTATHAAIATAAALIAYHYSADFKAEHLLTLVDKLVSVSAVIFAIMGVWLSVTKVEIEQKVKDSAQAGNGNEADKAIDRARFLVVPMTTSALTLLFSLFFYLGYFLLPMFELSAVVVAWIKGVTLATLIFGYITIAFNTVPVFLSGGLFLIDLMNLRNDQLRGRNEHGERIEDDDN